MKQKRSGKRKKKIANGHNQIDALGCVLEVEGINSYEIDLEGVFDPTRSFKHNKNHLLETIETFRKDNDRLLSDLRKGVMFIYVPFMYMFFSFWMYFQTIMCIN